MLSVLPDSACAVQRPQTAHPSSRAASASFDRFVGFSNSSIAFLVAAFGTRTSNGIPFRRTTCRKNIVIASVVLTPTAASTRAARALSFGSIRAVMYPVFPMSIRLIFVMLLMYPKRDTRQNHNHQPLKCKGSLGAASAYFSRSKILSSPARAQRSV